MTIYLPNFEIDSQKFLYVDIWNLAVSPDGSNVFTAKDNECIVADFCNVLKPLYWFLKSLDIMPAPRACIIKLIKAVIYGFRNKL
jgi:hypothetical protein